MVSTWSSGATTANWNDSTNWDVVPVLSGTLQFGESTITTLNDNLATSATSQGALVFTSTASAYTISGNAITLGTTSAATIISNSSAQVQTINNNIKLGAAAQTVSTVAGGGLVLNGVITGVNTSSNLTLAGDGFVTLAGANTFTGGVTLNSGTLNINKSSALGMSGTFVINGGTLDNTSGTAITTSNYVQTWNGDFAFTGSSDGTHDLNLGTGAVGLGAASGTARTVTVNAGNLTVGGVIGDGTTAKGLIKSGNGTLTLGGANTFTGGMTLNSGTLNINKAAALGTGNFTINGGTLGNTSGGGITMTNAQTWAGDFSFGWAGMYAEGNLTGSTGNVTLAGSGSTRTITTLGRLGTLTISNVISGAGIGITKNGPGTLLLNAANTFDGGITLNEGVLQISNVGALGTGTLTINGGSIKGNGTALALSTNNAQVWNGDFTVFGTGLNYQPATLNFGAGAITLKKNVTVTNAGNILIEGGAIDDGGSNYGVTWLTGVIPYYNPTTYLTGTSTYSGATVFRSLTGSGAAYMATGYLLNTSSVTISGGALFSTGTSGVGVTNRINPSASLTLGGDGGGIFRLMGSQNATVNQQSFTSLTVGAGANSLYTDQTGNVSKVTFTGANPYTRSVGGVVRIAGLSVNFTNAPSGTGNVFGSGTSAILLGAVWQNGSTATDANAFVGVSSGSITAISSVSNTWGTGVNTDVLANTIALAGTSQTLRFNGGGSLTLPGDFTVESGGILASNNPSVPVKITGGTIKTGIAGSDLWIVQGNTANAYTGMVIGSQIIDNAGSSLTKVGPRALYLTNNNNTYSGGTYLSEGILNVTSAGSLGTGALNFTGSATLQASGNVALGNRAVTISTGGNAIFDTNGYNIGVDGTISGTSASLTKTGVGTLTLTGTNSYTGITSVLNGTLKLDFSGADSPISDIINPNSLITTASPVYYGGAPQYSAASATIAIQGKANTANSQTFSGTSANLDQSGISIGQGITHLNFSAGEGGTLTVNLGSIAQGVSNSGSPNTMLDISIGTGVTVTTSNVLASNGALSAVTSSTTAQSNVPWITVNGTTFATLSGSNIVGLADSAYSTNYASTATYLDVRTTGTLTSAAGNSPGSLRFNDTNGTGSDITLTLRQGGALTGVSGPILVTSNVGAHTSTITGGYLYGVWNSKDLVIAQNNTQGDLVIASEYMDTNGSASISKSGAGRVIFTGTNINTGNTYVNEGTLVATGDYTSGTTVTLTTTSGTNVVTVSDATGLFVGQRITGTGIYAASNTSPVIITAINGTTLTLSQSSTSSAVSTGTFQSGGALGGSRAYSSGTAYISTSGTLQIGDGGTHGSLDPNNVISNLGSFILNRSDAFTFGTQITGTVAANGLAGSSYTNTFEVKGGGTATLGSSGVLNGSAASGTNIYVLSSAGNVYVGQLVVGTGIAAGTTVTGVDGLNVKLSSNTTAAASNLTFTTNNTFAGITRITGGSTLILGSALALGNSTLSYNKSDSGTFTFGALTSATLGGLSGDKNLSLTNASSSAVALTVGGNHMDSSYSGNLSGAGSLTKNGIGILTLTGTNSYSGGTTLNAGTLKGNADGLQGNIATAASTSVIFDQATAGTYAATISGAGSFTKIGGGTLTLSATNGYSGGTYVQEGVMALATTGSLNTGGAVMITGGTLDIGTNVQSTGALTMTSGALVGTGAGQVNASSYNFVNSGTVTAKLGGNVTLTKSGTGTLAIRSSSSYSGVTTVQQGTLIVSGSLGNTSAVSGSAGSILSIEGGLIKTGATITSAGIVQGKGSVGAVSISAGGRLNPGVTTETVQTTGTLTANGNVTFADSTSTFSIRLSNTGSDKLAIASGNLTLNQVTLALDVTNYTANAGDTFTIVSGGAGATGSGSNMFLQGTSITASGIAFGITYATGVGGKDIVLEVLAVPEPATWSMLVTGIGMLFGLNRIRRNRAL